MRGSPFVVNPPDQDRLDRSHRGEAVGAQRADLQCGRCLPSASWDRSMGQTLNPKP